MKKLIDISEETAMELKILAIREKKTFKAFLEEILTKFVEAKTHYNNIENLKK
tara:strand:- start:8045 stop:8203 length:159 start_codon:yes stop_codon:yes gene_type:complete